MGCEQKIIGSDAYPTIDGLEFTITSYETTNYGLIASGTVTNTNPYIIQAAWWVEAMFYADSTLTFLLGGDDTRMNYSLPPNSSTHWELMFNDNNIDPLDYPDFRISNLRGHD
jgi:hypothetical protein